MMSISLFMKFGLTINYHQAVSGLPKPALLRQHGSFSKEYII
jgi:hypothetical protein